MQEECEQNREVKAGNVEDYNVKFGFNLGVKYNEMTNF